MNFMICKWTRAVALVALVAYGSSAFADFLPSQSLVNDAAMAYGYFVGQSQTVSRIAREFPALANRATMASQSFALRFEPAVNGIDSTMTAANSAEWGKIKRAITKDIKQAVDSQALTSSAAGAFLDQVVARSKGQIETPVLETLLLFHPSYMAQPASEMLDGFKQKYVCDGSGKAKGVALSIEVPKSWKFSDGERPNVVKKFLSANGSGYESVMLMIMSAPMDMQSEMKELAASDRSAAELAKESLPEEARFLEAGALTIEGLPGYWCRYSTKMTRVRSVVESDNIAYTVFWKKNMIQIQCQVATSLDGERLNKTGFGRYAKLFELVANSLVITSRY